MSPTIRKRVVATGGAMAIALAGVVAFSGGGAENLVTVQLADAGPLEVGDEVRAAGVEVGTVKSVSLVGGSAKVVLSVASGVLPLHDDASVTLRPINILGEDYIDLNPGTASRPFSASASIPAARTRVAGTVQDLISTFQAPTAAGLASVVTTAGEGLNGNGGNVSKVLEQLTGTMQLAQKLGDLLSQQNGSLSQLVTSADPVAAAIATKDGARLDSLVGSTTDILNAIASQQDALKATLDQLPQTLVSGRRTLEQFAGVADQATPALASLRPLTGNLSSVVDELQGFTNAANPALASLPAVLNEASALLDQAAPVVAALRQSGPGLARAAANLNPVSDQLLERHIGGLMGFVKKWALSTNGSDGLSHYFRGVVYVTPTELNSLLTSLFPSGLNLGTASGAKPSTASGGVSGLTSGLTNLLGGTLSGLSGTTSQLGGLVNGLLGGKSTQNSPSATGLSSTQEHSLLSQLLGGN